MTKRQTVAASVVAIIGAALAAGPVINSFTGIGNPGSQFRAGPARTGVYPGSGVPTLQGTKWRFETEGSVTSSPAVANGVVYIGSRDNHLYAVDAETGQQRWRFETDGSVTSSPAVANGAVYVGSRDNHLYAVDAETGQQRWRFETEGSVYSSPAVANGAVYVGSLNNHLYALQ